MSITNKMMNFGNKSTVELEQLQGKLQAGLAETRERIKIYMQKVTTLCKWLLRMVWQMLI